MVRTAPAQSNARSLAPPLLPLAFDKSSAVCAPTRALYASIAVALMLPLQFGWSVAQLNLSAFASQDACDARPVHDGTCLMFPGHSQREWTFAVNAWIVGGMVGSLLCGRLADARGRRVVLMASALFMIAGGTIQASASAISVFVLGRLLAGIASGCATGIVGAYVNELAPPHLRSTFSGGLQISLSLGGVFVVCAFFVASTGSGWRYLAGFQVLWGVLFLALAAPLLAESPAWLLARGKRDDATQVIERLYGDQHVALALFWFESSSTLSGSDPDLEAPLPVTPSPSSPAAVGRTSGSYGTSSHAQPLLHPSRTQQSTVSLLMSPLLRRQLVVAITLATAQQLSGIGAVSYYSSGIFVDAGITDDRVGTLIANVMGLLPALATGPLVSRFGYRRMLLAGFLGMLASAIGITVALHTRTTVLSIVFVSTFVGVFSATLGPLVYVVTADLFPTSVRATASSVCIFMMWLANLTIGASFPSIAAALRDLAFLPFIAALATFFGLTYALLPETLNKTNDAIQREFLAQRAVSVRTAAVSIDVRI